MWSRDASGVSRNCGDVDGVDTTGIGGGCGGVNYCGEVILVKLVVVMKVMVMIIAVILRLEMKEVLVWYDDDVVVGDIAGTDDEGRLR